MAKHSSKGIFHWIGGHTLWHFTGAPLLEAIIPDPKKWLGSGVLAVFVTYGSRYLPSRATLVLIGCAAFGIILFFWDMAEKRLSRGPETKPASPQPVVSAEAATYALDRAPAPLVKYFPSGSRETLEIYNDGPTAAEGIVIGPLRLSEQRHIGIFNEIPPIPSKQTEPVPIWLKREKNHAEPLYDFMRARTPADAKTCVLLTYRNSAGVGFERDFELKSFSNGQLIWNPGPVMLRGAADSQSQGEKLGSPPETQASLRQENARLSAELSRLKPRLGFPRGGLVYPGQMGKIVSLGITNCNSEEYAVAYGVHGTLEVRSEGYNPCTYDLCAIGESDQPDAPTCSVQIPAARQRGFAYLIELPGRFHIPKVDPEDPKHFQRGPELRTNCSHVLIARLEGRNVDPIECYAQIDIDTEGKMWYSVSWSMRPSSAASLSQQA